MLGFSKGGREVGEVTSVRQTLWEAHWGKRRASWLPLDFLVA